MTIATVSSLLGCIFLLDWVAYQPVYRLFFRAYEPEDSVLRKALPSWAIRIAWGVAAFCIASGVAPLLGSLTLWPIFRTFFIRRRWTSVLRGAGAPGFMSHYAVAALSFLHLSILMDPSGGLSEWVLFALRIDLAVILIDAGIYKTQAGYAQSDGMDYGLANPIWGYWWRFFRRLPPSHPFFRLFNHAGYATEICAGLLMLIPLTVEAGAWLASLTFVVCLATIRLGRLAGLMALLPLLFVSVPWSLDLSNLWFGRIDDWSLSTPNAVLLGLKSLTVLYVVSLGLVKTVHFTNFYGKRSLSEPLQRWVTRYADQVPIIMWRVFTADIVNFFVRVSLEWEGGTETTANRKWVVHECQEYSAELSRWSWRRYRAWQVAESIAVTSVFTLLKYHKPEAFEERLRRYANTFLDGTESTPARVCFEYVSIQKRPDGFVYRPVRKYSVDVATGTCHESILDSSVDPSAKAAFSKIRKTKGFGSYEAA